MADGLYNAVSGAVAASRQLEVVANNLANVGTAGFKAGRISFAEVLAQVGGTQQTSPTQSFVATSVVEMDVRPGPLRSTGNPLDVSLEGKGYLVFQDGEREVLSRTASLRLTKDGALVNERGLPVLGDNDRPLRIGRDPGQLTIHEDGTISGSGGTEDRLKLVEVDDPRRLRRLGRNTLAIPNNVVVEKAKETRVRQGFLESSNVNPIREMTSMILAARTYEAYGRMISNYKQLDSKLVNSVGRAGA